MSSDCSLDRQYHVFFHTPTIEQSQERNESIDVNAMFSICTVKATRHSEKRVQLGTLFMPKSLLTVRFELTRIAPTQLECATLTTRSHQRPTPSEPLRKSHLESCVDSCFPLQYIYLDRNFSTEARFLVSQYPRTLLAQVCR